MSHNEKKQYKCVLPTNGYVEGDTAWLTDADVANFNGGEERPRFVPVEEASESTTMSEENNDTDTAPEGSQPESQPHEGDGQQPSGENAQLEDGASGEAANINTPTE